MITNGNQRGRKTFCNKAMKREIEKRRMCRIKLFNFGFDEVIRDPSCRELNGELNVW